MNMAGKVSDFMKPHLNGSIPATSQITHTTQGWKELCLLFLNVNLNPFGFQLESYNSTSLENSILGRQQAQKATKMPESARAKDRKAGNSLKKLKKAELSTTG